MSAGFGSRQSVDQRFLEKASNPQGKKRKLTRAEIAKRKLEALERKRRSYQPFSRERLLEELKSIEGSDSIRPVESDKKITVTLGQLADLISCFDPKETGAVERFCLQAEALASSHDVQKTKHQVSPKPIPEVAPRRWANRAVHEQNPAQFIQDVYGEHLGEGGNLILGDIHRLDNALYRRYKSWLNEGSPDAPVGFHLPTKSESIGDEPEPSEETKRQVYRAYSRNRKSQSR